MSSSRTNPSIVPPPEPLFSTFNADPLATPYPVVPMTQRDGTAGHGRPCEICSKVIGLGTNGSLYTYNLHIKACQKKASIDRSNSLPAAPSTAATLSGIHRSTPLSPLIIGGHLDTSLSPSPSPTHSPTSPLTSVSFDVGSDSDIHLSASVQVTPDPPFVNANPAISINPPSDDLPSPTIILYQPTLITCSGVLVQWTPGTIWETYPFPSHSFVNHPWDIIEFRPPSHIFLRSKDCTGIVDAGTRGVVCHECLWIPQCDAYKTIEKCARSAPPHTPHHLLAFHQLSCIPKTLRKMLNEARLKVVKNNWDMNSSLTTLPECSSIAQAFHRTT